MIGLTHHLARRSVEQASTLQHPQIEPWKASILFVTTALALVTISLIGYIYEQVVATLVMVENPKEQMTGPTKIVVSDEKTGEVEIEVEGQVVKPELLSLRFFKTLGQLRARAGPRAAYRGFGVWLLFHFIDGLVQRFINSVVPNYFDLTPHFAAAVSTILITRLMLAWTLVVIAEPTFKFWRCDALRLSSAKKVIVPTLILALTNQIQVLIMRDLSVTLSRPLNDPEDLKKIAPSLATNVLAAIIVFVAFHTPARIMLTRIQASLLPDEVEAIVPFDRSFGGKVAPAITGGSGVLSIKDALRSIDGRVFRRVMTVYAKTIALQLFAATIFIGIYVAELYLMIGGLDFGN
ncbi:MAG: hypothetical protein M4579_000776 [Chaenotheca gracillima]|nr:MAG: hypothetical protein M4579_000776 [Chaenotheca gracillima]